MPKLIAVYPISNEDTAALPVTALDQAIAFYENVLGELQRSGGRPGEFGVDQWGGRSHRTFFVREDENGYCYCFYHPLEATTT